MGIKTLPLLVTLHMTKPSTTTGARLPLFNLSSYQTKLALAPNQMQIRFLGLSVYTRHGKLVVIIISPCPYPQPHSISKLANQQ